MKNPLLRRALLVGSLLVWCASLLTIRTLRTHSLGYSFFAPNLFLATIPAVASVGFVDAYKRGKRIGVRAVWLVAWLVFLPNAPYLATDLIHLTNQPPVPFWFDAALFLSCAGTGLVLGYSSVLDVHRVIAGRFGDAAGWVVAAGALTSSAFGVYMGRVLRWNSWDVLLNPLKIVATIGKVALDPFSHVYSVLIIAFCAVGLVLGYAALRALVTGLDPQRTP